MSPERIELSYEFIQEAGQSPGVIEATRKVAKRIAKRAESIASSEQESMSVWVESGIRPGGRAFSNVVTDGTEQEFGTSKRRKRRILGRAADEAK